MSLIVPPPPAATPILGENPFQSDLCRKCWFEHLASKFSLGPRHGDLVVHRKPVFKNLLTLNELKVFASNLAWFQDFDAARAEAFLSMPPDLRWDYLYLVWNEERRALQQFQALEKWGFQLVQMPGTPMYMVDLSAGYEGYLAAKTSKFRYNVRQKLKNAEKAGMEMRIYERYEDIEPFFEQFFTHHIPYWTQKIGHSFYSNPLERQFTVAWAQQLHHAGKLRLHGLYMGGELVNMSMSIIEGDTLYWLLTINTGLRTELFPGLVSLYLRLREAGEAGIRSFNMGYGEYNYKNMVATHVENRQILVMPNPQSVRGRLYAVRAARRKPAPDSAGPSD